MLNIPYAVITLEISFFLAYMYFFDCLQFKKSSFMNFLVDSKQGIFYFLTLEFVL